MSNSSVICKSIKASFIVVKTKQNLIIHNGVFISNNWSEALFALVFISDSWSEALLALVFISDSWSEALFGMSNSAFYFYFA